MHIFNFQMKNSQKTFEDYNLQSIFQYGVFNTKFLERCANKILGIVNLEEDQKQDCYFFNKWADISYDQMT